MRRDDGILKPREQRPVLEIAVKGSRAHSAGFQLLAASDFVRQPMQTMGSVGLKGLEVLHPPDSRRDADKPAAIQTQMLDGLQPCDARRKRDKLAPLFTCHLPCRNEFF